MTTQDTPLEERIAQICHEQWAHWMHYVFTKAFAGPGHSVCIPSPFKSRWMKQIKTPYAELTEQEKESDREWARKYCDAFAQWENDLDAPLPLIPPNQAKKD